MARGLLLGLQTRGILGKLKGSVCHRLTGILFWVVDRLTHMDDKQSRSEARLVVFFAGGVRLLSSRSAYRRRPSFFAGLPVLLFFLGLLCAFLFFLFVLFLFPVWWLEACRRRLRDVRPCVCSI
jgi:hypothetical protein